MAADPYRAGALPTRSVKARRRPATPAPAAAVPLPAEGPIVEGALHADGQVLVVDEALAGARAADAPLAGGVGEPGLPVIPLPTQPAAGSTSIPPTPAPPAVVVSAPLVDAPVEEPAPALVVHPAPVLPVAPVAPAPGPVQVDVVPPPVDGTAPAPALEQAASAPVEVQDLVASIPRVPLASRLPSRSPLPGPRPAASTPVDTAPVAEVQDPTPTTPAPREQAAPARQVDRKKAREAKHAAEVVRITPRDRYILRELTRFRFMTYGQMAAHFAMSEAALRRRIPKLQRQGLVDAHRKNNPSRFTLWHITDEGAAFVQSPLRAPRAPGLSTVRHLLGITDLAIAFTAAGEVVITEAEIRALDTANALSEADPESAAGVVARQGHRVITDQPIFAIPGAPGSRHAMHVPDLVLAREPVDGVAQSVAVEFEIEKKAPSRIAATLRAYASAPNIGAAVYYTPDPTTRDLLRRQIRESGTSHLVSVRKFEPSEASGVE